MELPSEHNWGKLCGLYEAIWGLLVPCLLFFKSNVSTTPPPSLLTAFISALQNPLSHHCKVSLIVSHACYVCYWLMHYYGITVWTHLRIIMRLLWSNRLILRFWISYSGASVLTLLLLRVDTDLWAKIRHGLWSVSSLGNTPSGGDYIFQGSTGSPE